ncbi:MAG: helix-turn-helix domain-containing protein [Armatimonadota bacterium]|nr:helix-turn-helix domain-containing protein [Armatimonadota bacterium]
MSTAPTPSYSPVPDAVLTLVRDGRLLRADAPLLHALLTHKRRGRDEVWPRQQTLADALGCSVRTVQRGLDRLCAACLIRKCPRVSPEGATLRGLRYDLSPLAVLLPTPPRDTRHGCRPESKKDKDVVLESNSRPAAVALQELSDVCPDTVAALTRAGVFPNAAARLTVRHGAGRCRAALSTLASQPNIRDRAAWLVACLQGGWAVPSSRGAGFPRPPSPHRPCTAPTPPAPKPTAPDPLDALPPAQYAAWEARARAELIADVSLGPVVRSSLSRGRSPFLVRNRMRQWLAPPDALECPLDNPPGIRDNNAGGTRHDAHA